jgi:glycosyltransferase involved in cell wall biosynthesis
MKKIFCYPTHCDGKHVPGVDYVRIIRPMEELGKQEGFEVRIYNGEKDLDWRDIAKEYDVFYLNYITNAAGYVISSYNFVKEGKKVVYDIDDLIWEIQEDNAAYSTYAPGSEGRAVITDIIARGAHRVTCTNDFLRKGIAQYTGKSLKEIEVFKNYIDLDLYSWKSPLKDNYEVKIGYFGSSSHFNDLVNPGFVNGLQRLMEEDPRIRFYTIGAMIQQIKKKFGPRYTTGFGDHDIYKWVNMMPLMMQDVDIVVAPLVDITYARAKSSIKFLEYSSMAIPGCYQDIRQYQEVVEHGKNGFLCKTKDDWYKHLKELADSVEFRRRIGKKSYKTVKKDWTIQKNVKHYVDYFGSL